jgi:hypothetical protein
MIYNPHPHRAALLRGIRLALMERDMRAVAALLHSLAAIAPDDAKLIRDTIEAMG